MRTQPNGKTDGRAKKRLTRASLILCLLLTHCAEVKLGTIPTPPPSAKLRIFVKGLSGEHDKGKFGMPHDKFEENLYRHIRRVFADGTTYVAVPKE